MSTFTGDAVGGALEEDGMGAAYAAERALLPRERAALDRWNVHQAPIDADAILSGGTVQRRRIVRAPGRGPLDPTHDCAGRAVLRERLDGSMTVVHGPRKGAHDAVTAAAAAALASASGPLHNPPAPHAAAPRYPSRVGTTLPFTEGSGTALGAGAPRAGRPRPRYSRPEWDTAHAGWGLRVGGAQWADGSGPRGARRQRHAATPLCLDANADLTLVVNPRADAHLYAPAMGQGKRGVPRDPTRVRLRHDEARDAAAAAAAQAARRRNPSASLNYDWMSDSDEEAGTPGPGGGWVDAAADAAGRGTPPRTSGGDEAWWRGVQICGPEGGGAGPPCAAWATAAGPLHPHPLTQAGGAHAWTGGGPVPSRLAATHAPMPAEAALQHGGRPPLGSGGGGDNGQLLPRAAPLVPCATPRRETPLAALAGMWRDVQHGIAVDGRGRLQPHASRSQVLLSAAQRRGRGWYLLAAAGAALLVGLIVTAAVAAPAPGPAPGPATDPAMGPAMGPRPP